MTPDQQQLVLDHINIAEMAAVRVWKTAQHALELDELKSLAYLGLVHAAVRWEPYCEERGFDPEQLQFFVPFAQRRSEGAVRDAIRTADWANRSLRTRHKMLLEAGLERGASEREMATKSGLSVAEVRSTKLGMARKPVSLDVPEIELGGQPGTVESSALATELLQATVEAVRQLDEVSQTVIVLRYYSGMEIKEVAAQMGLTESRASHIHTNAVLKVHEIQKQTAMGERPVQIIYNVQSVANVDPAKWRWFQKKVPTRMLPAKGPARFVTKDGIVDVSSDWKGYVALDSEGYPYPLEASIHDQSYEQVEAPQ